MTTTLAYTGTLHIIECGVCAVPHAIPDEMYRDRRDNGGNWYCPNGHHLHFITTEAEKLRKQLDRVKSSEKWYFEALTRTQQERDAAERSARAYRGHVTRLRNRIADGVCPVDGCRRNFANVKGHIARMHPTWAHEHPEALA